MKLWEAMAYGCQLVCHRRVSYGGEGKSVLKQDSVRLVDRLQFPSLGHQGRGRQQWG